MFPRAARFDRERLSDTPGPNAYDPTEMVAHYKKGLLTQKDTRFKAGQQNSTSDCDDGASTSAAAFNAATSTSAHSSINKAAALKEKAKMATRIAKAEERVANLEKQVHSLTNDKSQSLADLRISQQQVEKLQTQLAKTKGQTSRVVDSPQKKQLAELQRNLEQSKHKERIESEKWTSKYFSLQHENTSLQHENASLQHEKKRIEAEWARAKTVIASTKKEIQTLQNRESEFLQQLETERETRRIAEEGMVDVRERMERQEALCHTLQDENDRLAREVMNQQDQIDDGIKSIQEQSQQKKALQIVATDNALLVEQLRRELKEVSMERLYEKAQIRRQRVRLEQQSIDLEESRAIIAQLEETLREERLICQETLVQLDQALSRCAMRQSSDSLDLDLEETFSASDEEISVLLKMVESVQMAGEAALHREKDNSARLREDLDQIQAQYLDALHDVGTLQETQRTLEAVRQELESVEEAYEKSLLEAMRAHKKEEEAKRELNSSKAENDILMVRIRQSDKIGQKLFHAKMKEETWLQERGELLEEIETYQHMESEYMKLRSQAEVLLSKSTLYEGQMEELTSLNTILASHGNPSQKIFYLDRIRKELDEKRTECQVLAVERDQFKAVSRDLQVKLDLFCKVESRLEDRPRTAFRRVARQSLGDPSSPTKTTKNRSSTNGVLMERSPNKRFSPIKVRKYVNGREGEMKLDELTRGLL